MLFVDSMSFSMENNSNFLKKFLCNKMILVSQISNTVIVNFLTDSKNLLGLPTPRRAVPFSLILNNKFFKSQTILMRSIISSRIGSKTSSKRS